MHDTMDGCCKEGKRPHSTPFGGHELLCGMTTLCESVKPALIDFLTYLLASRISTTNKIGFVATVTQSVALFNI